MANTRLLDLQEVTENLLLCSICLEAFEAETRVPRLLPCRHSFCTPCLESQCQATPDFRCPTCRTEVGLQGSLVSSLPVDIISMKILDYSRAKQSVQGNGAMQCLGCPDAAPAVVCCQECDQCLCDKCRQTHLAIEGNQDHRMVSMSQLVSSPGEFFCHPETCPEHRDCKLRLFCDSPECQYDLQNAPGPSAASTHTTTSLVTRMQDADVPKHCQAHRNPHVFVISTRTLKPLRLHPAPRVRLQVYFLYRSAVCSKCVTSSHKEKDSHDIIDLNVAYERLREKNTVTCQGLVDKQRDLEEDIEKREKDIKELVTLDEAALGEIEAMFEEVVDEIKRRRKELITSLKESTKEEIAVVKDYLNNARSYVKRVQATSSYVIKTVSVLRPAEFLSIESALHSSAKELLEAPISKGYNLRRLKFERKNVEDLLGKIAKCGEILDSATTPPPHDANKPRLLVTEGGTDQGACAISDFGLKVYGVDVNEKSDPSRSDRILDINISKAATGRHRAIYLPVTEKTQEATLVHCPSFILSGNLANVDKCSLTRLGTLLNSACPASLERDDTSISRLRNYGGTLGNRCMTGKGRRYWQVQISIKGKQALEPNNLLCELALAHTNTRDESHYVGFLKGAWSFELNHCNEHRGRVCAWGSSQKKRVHHSKICDYSPEFQLTVTYGLLLDLDLGRLDVLDLKRGKRLFAHKDVDVSKPLWPMFGVYSSGFVETEMTLQTGQDINVDKALIALLDG